MPIQQTSIVYNEILEVDSSGKTLYQGWYRPQQGGSSGVESKAIFMIQKFVYSGFAIIEKQWAEGNANEDKVWNDRASYSY